MWLVLLAPRKTSKIECVWQSQSLINGCGGKWKPKAVWLFCPPFYYWLVFPFFAGCGEVHLISLPGTSKYALFCSAVLWSVWSNIVCLCCFHVVVFLTGKAAWTALPACECQEHDMIARVSIWAQLHLPPLCVLASFSWLHSDFWHSF